MQAIALHFLVFFGLLESSPSLRRQPEEADRMTTAVDQRPVLITPEEFHRIFPTTNVAFQYNWKDGDPAKTPEELIGFCHGHHENGGITQAYRQMLHKLPSKALANAFIAQMTSLYPNAESTWSQMPGDMGDNWTITSLVATANVKCTQLQEVDGIPTHIIALWAPLFRDAITLLRQNHII